MSGPIRATGDDFLDTTAQTYMPDRYGRRWPNVPMKDRCTICGQPTTGDCDHTPIEPETP